MNILSPLKKTILSFIHSWGYDLVPSGFRGESYLSYSAIMKECKQKSIDINQYFEQLWGLDTHSRKIIKMLDPIKKIPELPCNIVEIGAGSGLYTEKLIEELGLKNIKLYQIYETAPDWAAYLKNRFPVELPFSDGYQLSSTPSASAHFVHAHGLFIYTSFVTNMCYLNEISRITASGGVVCFDAFDETCFAGEYMDKWIASGITYMNLFPEKFILETFEKNGFQLINQFYIEFNPARARYYIFQKNANEPIS